MKQFCLLLIISSATSFAMESAKAPAEEKEVDKVWSYHCHEVRVEKSRREKEAKLAKKEQISQAEITQMLKERRAQISARVAATIMQRKAEMKQQKQLLNDSSD